MTFSSGDGEEPSNKQARAEQSAQATNHDGAASAQSEQRITAHIQLIYASPKNHPKCQRFGKEWALVNGCLTAQKSGFVKYVIPKTVTINGLGDAAFLLRHEAKDPRVSLFHGALNMADERVMQMLEKDGHVTRTSIEKVDKNGKVQLPCFIEVPRTLWMWDFDPTPAQVQRCRDLGLDLYADPEGAIRACAKEWFPQDIARASYIYQFSASAGIG
jgi:hypothetical protein